MDSGEVRKRLDSALAQLVDRDRHLLENNLSERCIAARLAMHLQNLFDDLSVDAEYNRQGGEPKKLGLPDECANKRDEDGKACVIPDVIIHTRGSEGPNLLVLELKKTTNPDQGDCDRMRLRAFQAQLHYSYGALIICETPRNHAPKMAVADWIEG